MNIDRLYLSRRNLLLLLSKLDRVQAGESSTCAIHKKDPSHPTHPQTMQICEVVAVEDEEYYHERRAGGMFPPDSENVLKQIEDINLRYRD